jgi:hypothetical protein
MPIMTKLPSVDSVLKAMGLLTLASYLAGLFATVLYLRQLDVALPDLVALKPRFISTGLLALSAAALTASLPRLAWTLSGMHAQGGDAESVGPKFGRGRTFSVERLLNPPRVLLACLNLIFPALLLWMIYALLMADREYVNGRPVVEATWLVAIGILVGILSLASQRSLESEQSRLGQTMFLLALLGSATAWFVGAFTSFVLPVVPDQFGGLKATAAQIALNEGGVKTANGLGVPLNGNVSEPLWILFEGNEYVALRLADGRTVQIKNDQIAGSITDSKRPTARSIRTRNRAHTVGALEEGDQLVLRYSERLNPMSVIAHWTGKSASVSLKFELGGTNWTTMTVWNEARTAEADLGEVTFFSYPSRSLGRTTWLAATIAQRGPDIELTIGGPLPSAELKNFFGGPTTMRWWPSNAATDFAGNQVGNRDGIDEQVGRGDGNGSLVETDQEF